MNRVDRCCVLMGVLLLSGCGFLDGVAPPFGRKVYMAEARILVQEDAADEAPLIPMTPEQVEASMRTQAEIIRSRPILYTVVENLNLQKAWGKDGDIARDEAYRILFDALEVERYRDTSLLAIKAFRPDPEEAARIANEVAAAFRDHRFGLRRREVQRGLDALEHELNLQQKKVDEAEKKLVEARAGGGAAAPRRRLDAVALQRLDEQIQRARLDMITRRARLEKLGELEDEEFIGAAGIQGIDLGLNPLRQNIAALEMQLLEAQATRGAGDPEVQRLTAARDQQRNELQRRITGAKKGLRADSEIAEMRLKALQKESGDEKGEQAEEAAFAAVARAERELKIQEAVLDALKARVAREGIEIDLPRSPVEIVDPADVPTRPVRR
ncbi:MAG: hypothetical protein JXB04_09710 [Kiritimatiellae bacterium]|nr:hypothetical protein [Kiritimatiellia bacterium]